MELTATEVRILGALVEKQATTPDVYPLSLNALMNACNQSSNRDPVMELSEDAVRWAINNLRQQSLVRAIQRADARVMKYEHLLTDKLQLDGAELAVMCVLMLRGPQTAGEIKGRTGRLHEFASRRRRRRRHSGAGTAVACRRATATRRAERSPLSRTRCRRCRSTAPTAARACASDDHSYRTRGRRRRPHSSARDKPSSNCATELAAPQSAFEEFKRQF